MAVFVGVDWGCGAHAVCVIDATGRVLGRFEAGHDREGLQTLVTRLNKHGEPAARYRSPSSDPRDFWSMCWWKPASPSCRSIPTW
jgi:hypothetical protein